MKISLENGKYEVIFNEKDGRLSVYRYGEFWSDETGNNLLLTMIQRIKDLEDELDSTISVIGESYLLG